VGKVTFDVIANSRSIGFEATNAKILQQAAIAKKANEDSQKQLGLLSTALAAAGAAAVPLAGVAAGAFAGLGASAAVATVGILGVKDAMKEGTPLGQAYQKSFTPIVTEFEKLKSISATNLFSGINAGLKGLQPVFPQLNRDTALMAKQIGDIASHAGPGLASLFIRLNPLFITFGGQLVQGAAAFQRWAQGSASVGRFVAYVQQTLPSVEQTIGSLVTTVAHVAVAAEGFGGTTLTAIRLFSTAVNAIPIGTLQLLVPTLLGLKVGLTLSAAASNASTSLEKFSGKLAKTKGLAGEASGLMGGLGKAVGVLGPIGVAASIGLGILSGVLGRSKQQAIENTRYVNELTQAIQNNTVAQTTLTLLQQSGALQAGKDLALTQQNLIQAVTGGLDKYKKVTDQLQQMQTEYARLDEIRQRFISGGATENNLSQQQSARYNQLQKDIPKVADQVERLRVAYAEAKKAAADQAKQLGDSALAAQVNSGAVGKVASQWGLTADAYYQAKIAADKNTQSIQQQTIAMQLQSDAAGLLNQELSKLGNQNLSVAQAQTALAQANLSVLSTFKGSHNAITGNTAAALANQQAIQNSVSSAESLATAIGKQTGSTKDEIASLKNSKAALEDTLRSQDRLTPAVQDYIDKLFQIPKKLPPTKIDVDRSQAQAAIDRHKAQLRSIPAADRVLLEALDRATGPIQQVKNALAGLQNKTITVTAYASQVLGTPTYSKTHDSGHRATGGRVLGGHRYTVNELGQELYVRDNDGAYLIPGGPHEWTAPASGQIITATTIRSLRNRIGNLAGASLQNIPGAARAAINAVGNILPFGSPITRALQAEDKVLEQLVARRVQLANRLKDANNQLAATQQAFNQEARTVQTGVVGSFDLLNAGKDVYGTISAGGILSDLRGSVSNASQFANDLRRLKGRIPNSVLQQLAEAGPSALPTLQALVGASPGQLRQFSALEGQLGSLGAAAGRTTASALFGARLRSEQNLIRALQAQEKATERLEQRMAQTIVKSVNITIHGGSAQEIVKTLDRYFARGGTLNSHGRIR
jgi:hypothetical protein